MKAEIRDEDGRRVEAGTVGILVVRGDQIAGEYATGSVVEDDGWFCTRDRASLDDSGYLFIEGRADDTIIRGGENIAPSEIEAVLCLHPSVAEACVAGLLDEEWGQRLSAVVVLRGEASVDELREFVRERLRGRRQPTRSRFGRPSPIRRPASSCVESWSTSSRHRRRPESRVVATPGVWLASRSVRTRTAWRLNLLVDHADVDDRSMRVGRAELVGHCCHLDHRGDDRDHDGGEDDDHVVAWGSGSSRSAGPSRATG